MSQIVNDAIKLAKSKYFKEIKEYIEEHGGAVDYVHGDDNLKKLDNVV